jgi:inositol oxygenase
MATLDTKAGTHAPLSSLEEWDDFVKRRYPEPATAFQAVNPDKKTDEFRNYAAEARPSVRQFYHLNHRHQTLDFVRAKKADYLKFDKREMSVWEAAEFLNTLVDDSDPDTDLSQLQHLLQTSEQIRKDGHPDWFVLTGFIHDLGKVLCLFGEPQWAVVGDTFPVGCAFSPKIVFAEYFAENADANIPAYQTRLGIYEEGCGLDKVDISWGHDEYIYQIAKPYLPEEGLYMLRYHSFYPWHREGEYAYLLDAKDRSMLKWVLEFNRYDLYTKSHEPPDPVALRPYYEHLVARYFPGKLRW